MRGLDLSSFGWVLPAIFVLFAQPVDAASSASVTIEPEGKDNFKLASFHLLIPDSVTKPRYILVLLPGLNGNGKRLLEDKRWRTFAEETNGAMVACTFRQEDPKKRKVAHYAAAQHGSGAALESALEQLDAKSPLHAIRDLPLLIYGHSAGGQFAYGFSCHRPKRMIGFAATKGGYYFPKPVDGTYDVPGLMISGRKDLDRRRSAIRALFESHRRKGAPWCWMEDASTHAQAQSLDIVMPYFRELLTLRLGKDPKSLAGIPKEAGVTIDLEKKNVLHEGIPTHVENANPRTGYLPSRSIFQEWARLDVGEQKYEGETAGGLHVDPRVQFFLEVTLGAEYGNKVRVIRKWQTPMKYKFVGKLTDKDKETFANVTSELHKIADRIAFQEAGPEEEPNLIVHFIPKKEFRGILKNAEKNCNGFLTFWWNREYVIRKAIVLIASDIRQEVRSCVIREEVTQAMGAINESDRYPDSVFHSRTDVSSFSEMDKYVISALYRDEVKAGMDSSAVERVLGVR